MREIWQRKRPRTPFRHDSPGRIRRNDSGQALPRHPQLLAYRCFLSDLAGFTRLRRVGPNHQRRRRGQRPVGTGLSRGIPPRCSGLRVQGTASSPSSTASLSMVGEPFGSVNRDPGRGAGLSQLGSRRIIDVHGTAGPPDQGRGGQPERCSLQQLQTGYMGIVVRHLLEGVFPNAMVPGHG